MEFKLTYDVTVDHISDYAAGTPLTELVKFWTLL